jgi:hypothetical protein
MASQRLTLGKTLSFVIMIRGIPMVKFTDTDLDLINELLRVASVSLNETIITVGSRYPGSPFIETLRKWQEQAADIRERIEAR